MPLCLLTCCLSVISPLTAWSGEAIEAASSLVGAKRVDCKVLAMLRSTKSIPTLEACAQGP